MLGPQAPEFERLFRQIGPSAAGDRFGNIGARLNARLARTQKRGVGVFFTAAAHPLDKIPLTPASLQTLYTTGGPIRADLIKTVYGEGQGTHHRITTMSAEKLSASPAPIKIDTSHSRARVYSLIRPFSSHCRIARMPSLSSGSI